MVRRKIVHIKKQMKMKVEYRCVCAYAIAFDADKYTCECPGRCSQKLTISVSQTG